MESTSPTSASWFASSTFTEDYKLVDFDRNRTTPRDDAVTIDQNVSMGYDGVQSILSTLMSTAMTTVLPQMMSTSISQRTTTSSWSSMLLTTLAENLNASTDQFGMRDSNGLGRCDSGSEIFNCTVEEYMLYMRGPQTLPIEQAIFVSSKVFP